MSAGPAEAPAVAADGRRSPRGPVERHAAAGSLGMAPQPRERYLRYDDTGNAAVGLGHWLTNLKCVALEASVLGRLAVVPPLALTTRHNFGVDRPWRWDTYFDLPAARLVDIVTGRSRPVALATRPPPRGCTSVAVEPGARVPWRHRSVDQVVRRVGSHYASSLPWHLRPNWIRLATPPSAEVAALARPVVERLRALTGGYAAVHLRRGDRARGAAYAPWAEATTPARVRAKLREHGVHRGTHAYFMSDERDPAYWRTLQDCCRIHRHTDFPSLAALVTGDASRPPDNYLLFVVEQEIMRGARLRIGTAWGTERPAADDWLVKPSRPGLPLIAHWVRRHVAYGPQARGAAWSGRR